MQLLPEFYMVLVLPMPAPPLEVLARASTVFPISQRATSPITMSGFAPRLPMFCSRGFGGRSLAPAWNSTSLYTWRTRRYMMCSPMPSEEVNIAYHGMTWDLVVWAPTQIGGCPCTGIAANSEVPALLRRLTFHASSIDTLPAQRWRLTLFRTNAAGARSVVRVMMVSCTGVWLGIGTGLGAESDTCCTVFAPTCPR